MCSTWPRIGNSLSHRIHIRQPRRGQMDVQQSSSQAWWNPYQLFARRSMSASQARPSEGHDTTIYTANAQEHCMRGELYHYVGPKIHQKLRRLSFDGEPIKKVIVRGHYDRTPQAELNSNEKQDKLFNWYRPTLTRLANNTVALNCFPGQDYTQHYASLVKTFYALEGQNNIDVEFELPEEHASRGIFLNSELADLTNVDVVIMGYVQHLEGLAPDSGGWQGGDLFRWRRLSTSTSQSVALLGCMTSYWGDISGDLANCIKEVSGAKCIIYVGKTGSLDPRDFPDDVMGTGSSSTLHNETLEWENALHDYLHLSSNIREGHHITIPTPLCQSNEWVKQWKDKARFVECEVGHIAKVCIQSSMAFGYLHIVTDNMMDPYPYNLSNERLCPVKKNRKNLLAEAEKVLQAFLVQGVP